MIYRFWGTFPLVIYFLVLCNGVNAAEKKMLLKVYFESEAPPKLYLSSFFGIQKTKIDSLMFNKNETFEFSLNEKINEGYYRISINDTNYIDVILSNKESVELIVKGNNLKRDTGIKKSIENKALWDLKGYRVSYNSQKRELFILQQKYINDSTKFLQIQKSLDSLQNHFNLISYELLNKNKNTYFYLTNKIILSPVFTDSSLLRNSYKNDTFAFLKENFFNNIDFSRETIVNSTLLPNQYMRYFEKYVEYSESGFREAIDFILLKAKANPVVYRVSLDFLLRLFDEAGPSMIFEYLVESYYDNNTCGVEYVEKAEKLKRLYPGNNMPDITLSSFSCDNIKQLYSKYKLTLIYFWSSHCSFCNETIPLLVETYNKYYDDGFQILGISLDEDKGDWLNYIKNNNINWLNYNDFKGWNSEPVRLMMVNKTPTFFLIDTNGVIVGKNHNFVNTNEIIRTFLSKE
jgi:thiol-disulfide isomerase/thioredoxin